MSKPRGKHANRAKRLTRGRHRKGTGSQCPRCSSTNVWLVGDEDNGLFLLRCNACGMESDVKKVKGFIEENMIILKVGGK